jgi:hypothetical protein
VAAKKVKRRHQPPTKVTVPPRNAKRWQAMVDQQQQLAQQAQMLGAALEGEVRAWAEGIAIRIGENDQPPHYHLAERCTELRAGKPPEPVTIDIKDLLKVKADRERKDKKKAQG